jgi:hypothetical protein
VRGTSARRDDKRFTEVEEMFSATLRFRAITSRISCAPARHIKLLLGLELARAENSSYLMDSLTPEGRSKKYIGGLALNF